MTLRSFSVIIFSGFVLLTALSMGGLAIYFIHELFILFTTSTNYEFTTIVGERLYLNVLLSFLTLSILVPLLSIPIGIYLFKRVSRPYLSALDTLSQLAAKRFDISNSDLSANERNILKRYIDVIRSDYQKLTDYEKERSWKEGARMLLHELKNPLTPLKMSVDSMLLNPATADVPEIQRIQLSLRDFEHVFAAFRELVSLKFGPKETFAMDTFLIATHDMFQAYPSLKWYPEVSDDVRFVTSEPSLLRMVFYNLVNNGMEANPNDFFVRITYTATHATCSFVTPKVSVDQPEQLMSLGVSSKGSGRGYGLYITKKILDYLNHPLHVRNTDEGLTFDLEVIFNE